MNLSSSRITRLALATLALGVVAVHVIDQGGLVGDKTPSYIGIGYWLLELAGLVACALLVLDRPWAHHLAAVISAGPLVGFVLTRGPGLPGATDDRGNWGEPLGLVALAVEITLLLAAAAVILHRPRSAVSAAPLPAPVADAYDHRAQRAA